MVIVCLSTYLDLSFLQQHLVVFSIHFTFPLLNVFLIILGFDVIISEIVFLISFLNCSSVYKYN